MDGVGTDKDGVEERTDWNGSCIQNSTDLYEHGMCVFIGSTVA